jgi:hypothetical protein
MATNKSEIGVIDVTFETGETIQTRYVIGADGAHSIVSLIIFRSSNLNIFIRYAKFRASVSRIQMATELRAISLN